MFLLGTIVDVLAILIGTAIGYFLPRIPDRMRETVTVGVALCVIAIGLNMALSDMNDIVLIIFSVVLGAVAGELLQIEKRFEHLAHQLELRFRRIYKGPVAQGFISATLLFCVGSMSIVGAVQDGLQGDHKTLFAKSVLDGFSSVVLTSTLGPGVGLAAILVLVYQGLIALISHAFGSFLDTPLIIEPITAAGGLLIVAIGLQLAGLRRISVANLLPAIVIAPVVKVVIHSISQI
ncbi:DUF554 domain-containing protein [Alicyclobacillus mali]|uniref:DUF554 domain-containing protein n=1 Tax=Alicyclobacillus mali (ex Roth et al. 2021) TaxID=1123961 RepID=A0ABS0F048_9BACL|nr:DUF554 domain-containing protein [Alicyclobacillus mali (ex Roth et al. 2021)]MBF8376669.1 DUF554 domain-containing protein [Alicyclobacillus mali (ex Roth et al. 2021)]